MREEVTLRGLLTEAGFDWVSGQIISCVGGENQYIDQKNSILDKKFDDGYGGNGGPEFIAEDRHNIYVWGVYDGAEWVEVIHKRIKQYLKEDALPRIGGG